MAESPWNAPIRRFPVSILIQILTDKRELTNTEVSSTCSQPAVIRARQIRGLEHAIREGRRAIHRASYLCAARDTAACNPLKSTGVHSFIRLGNVMPYWLRTRLSKSAVGTT